MIAAATLIILAGLAALALYLIVAFLQFLAHASLFGGLGLALVDIASVVPGDLGIFMMAALMASMAMTAMFAWRGWKAGLERVGMA